MLDCVENSTICGPTDVEVVADSVVAVRVEVVPAPGVELTVTARISMPTDAPSFAETFSVYVPAAEKSAVVMSFLALPNFTLPGPLICSQV